ncbi:hypothetical protein F8C70_17205 [Klebsiella aerogenes]|nr:hypothetical protein [Klebsiella aerogenes]RSW45152.1 hypothetical protein EGH44_18505 [Klebsiella aerogenes]RSW87786.1 hypothetical protein EGH53_25145 [Klebsiella aerogenes]TPW59121.1 hypothetical protein DL562_14715 [Klebsiella aerogenes]
MWNVFAPPVGRGKNEQSKKANDYPVFRRPFSTEVCRILPNFAAKAQEIVKRCANVIVNAQSINIFICFNPLSGALTAR